MDTFRIGIMGAAKIGAKFCDAVRRIPGAQVVAVASKSQERADAFAKANQVPAAYGDYRDMLKRPDIDGVYIDTTNNFHYENMMLCLDYDKPFLCEKAFTITRAQAEEVFRRAEENGGAKGQRMDRQRADWAGGFGQLQFLLCVGQRPGPPAERAGVRRRRQPGYRRVCV